MTIRSLSTSSVFASFLAFGAFATVLAAPAEAHATSQALSMCGLQPLAPAADRAPTDEITIPANAPALAFGVQVEAGAVDRISLKSNDGVVIATARETVANEIVLRLSESLVAGKAYVVEQSATCAPTSQALPAETVRFRAIPALAFPKAMGTITQVNQPTGAGAQPSSMPVLELAPADEATRWLPLTRFRVRAQGSSDPGIVTAYGARKGVSGGVELGWLGATCQSPRVTKVDVSATIAGQAEPYASQTVDVDTSAYCDEQDRLAAQSASANDTEGGCSATGRTPAPVGGIALAAVALALTSLARRRRTRS